MYEIPPSGLWQVLNYSPLSEMIWRAKRIRTKAMLKEKP